MAESQLGAVGGGDIHVGNEALLLPDYRCRAAADGNTDDLAGGVAFQNLPQRQIAHGPVYRRANNGGIDIFAVVGDAEDVVDISVGDPVNRRQRPIPQGQPVEDFSIEKAAVFLGGVHKPLMQRIFLRIGHLGQIGELIDFAGA